MSHVDPVVLLETRQAGRHHKVGVVTLNSPQSLNALSIDMINLIEPKLREWAQDDNIVCVWLQGAGDRAFCAGGDIVDMYKASLEKRGEVVPEVLEFFSREYQLDYLIQTYPKPFVVWGGGYVMGGGIGLMQGGSHRIVTERSRLAMPEISIGLYPDVGSTYFLNQLPDGMGLFLGLTATQMNAADAQWLGFADIILNEEQRESALHALCGLTWSDNIELNRIKVTETLEQLAQYSRELPSSALKPLHKEIVTLMQGDSVAEITRQILMHKTGNEILTRAQKTLAQGSPYSAHLIWQQMNGEKELTLEEVFQQELVWSLNCAMHGDFIEGIRALLIDKDRRPDWIHKNIDQVTSEDIQLMTTSPWSNGDHPLAHLGK